ncbi:MAG: hypothetical protein ACE5GE_17545, partial [Phycisphaerae bacterium]
GCNGETHSGPGGLRAGILIGSGMPALQESGMLSVGAGRRAVCGILVEFWIYDAGGFSAAH